MPQFLGRAITGMGGGCQKMYVIEGKFHPKHFSEGEGYNGIVTPIHQMDDEVPIQGGDDRLQQEGSQQKGFTHEKFGMTPFDQQQNYYNQQIPPNVDQKIEEREIMRHSTHRSQRSERLTAGINQTASDRFGRTDYISDNIEKPAFQQPATSQQQVNQNDMAVAEQEIHQEEPFASLQQMENHPEGAINDEEPSKMFTFEDNQQQQIQQQQMQDRGASQNSNLGREEQRFQGAPSRTQYQDNIGHLLQICSGKDHTLHLTRDGDVFSYGRGVFSSSGHGGSKDVYMPQVLKPLRDKRVIQVACGEHHSLILTDKYDVYSWGRGFEGQLGLSRSIEIASTPQYVKHFYGKPVTQITCGAYFSLAITKDNYLWGWGEAKLGQLGSGKQRIVQIPTRISVKEDEETVRRKTESQIQVGGDHEVKRDIEEVKVVQCSAGFGHTAALSEDGELFMWGFNNYGQLGIGDKKSRWGPVRVEKDIIGNPISRLVKVRCSYYATYAIDEYGHPYSWGKGFIGHSGETIEELPRKIELNTENRIFTDIYTNQNSACLYAPIRVFSISPKCGPAHGGTLISIIGTGFVNSDKLKVRFTYGDLSKEVGCQFDPKMKCLFCKTPRFEEFEQHPSLKLPCNCIISITMDGINYSECEEPFKIYSNEIFLTSINPKCGSVQGGTELTLLINIDEATAQNLMHLTIGFQPKKTVTRDQSKKTIGMSQQNAKSQQSIEKLNQSNQSSVRGSRANLSVTNQTYEQQALHQSQDKPVNPLDLSLNDIELDKENWTCTAGNYENGKIVCIVPELEQYDQESLQFNVDVALNGQQFTGRPLPFRYYDIQIEKIEPSYGLSEGGTVIYIKGQGLYDSANKRIKFETEGGERIVTAEWDRQYKCLKCIAPPLTWLFGGQELSEEELDEKKQKPIFVFLTFNNQEWISAKQFKYIDCKAERVAYAANFGADIPDPAQKEAAWLGEEPIELYPEEMPEEEKKKKDEEKQKKAEEEFQESQTTAKRKGVKIFVYGKNFIQTDVNIKFQYVQNLTLRFIYSGGTVQKDVQAIYKNDSKVACEIPDMGGEVPVGQHMVKVEVSLNGQQFTSNGPQFLFNSVDPNLTEEELKKLDEAEEKAKGKGGAKKK